MCTFTLAAIKVLLFILHVLCACNSKSTGARDIIAFCEHLRLPKDIELNIWSDNPIDVIPSTFYVNTLSQFISYDRFIYNSNINSTTSSHTSSRNVFIATVANSSTFKNILQQIGRSMFRRPTMKDKEFNWKSTYILWLSFMITAKDSNLYSQYIRDLPLDSDVYAVYQDEGSTNEMYFTELYAIKENVFIKNLTNSHHKFGGKGFHFIEIQRKVARRGQFNGIQIAGVAPEDNEFPHDVRFEKINGRTQFISGASVEMFFYLRDELDFTEKAVKGGWLFRKEDGTVAGESYSIIDSGDADLSISQVTILPYRAEALDFLQPTYLASGIQAFFRQPPPNTLRNIFISTFQPTMWLSLFVAWICIVIFFLILSRAQKLLYEYSEWDGEGVIVWAIGTTCQKGWHKFPTSTSMRLVFFTGSLMSLVIYTAYSAAIVSVLSVPLVAIRSFPDLISHHFTFTVHNDSATLQYLLQNLIESLHLDQEVVRTDSANAISRIISSTYAFMSYPDNFYAKAYGYNYSEQFLCDSLTRLPITTTIPDKSGMFVRKGSPFRKTFNHKIIRLKERGLNARCMQHYDMNTSPVCSHSQQLHTIVTKASLSCEDMITAYVIISLDFLLSLAVLIMEKVYYCRRMHTV